jgi:hypothetical protein
MAERSIEAICMLNWDEGNISKNLKQSTRQDNINLLPIGRVVNDIEYPSDVKWENIVSEVVIAPQLVEALDEIEGFSHVLINFLLAQGGRRPALPAESAP